MHGTVDVEVCSVHATHDVFIFPSHFLSKEDVHYCYRRAAAGHCLSSCVAAWPFDGWLLCLVESLCRKPGTTLLNLSHLKYSWAEPQLVTHYPFSIQDDAKLRVQSKLSRQILPVTGGLPLLGTKVSVMPFQHETWQRPSRMSSLCTSGRPQMRTSPFVAKLRLELTLQPTSQVASRLLGA